ncbi:MAG: XRE family transcriptional regulator [Oscillospiraceae bacterium]|jgi:transcriptional regulator with XRE-family HTH domain|nr:XRE family transcriptional regulator [Oscillospiraceae bacterium]
MLSDNIKKIRKEQKLSQEELAIQLHVVRQTLSKWENNLSVPDADQLITLADVLGVSVNALLGSELEKPDDPKDIATELEKANRKIAQYAEEKRLHTEAGKVRGLILWLTIIAIVISHVFRNEALAITLSSLLLIGVLLIMFRNLSLLSVAFNGESKTGSFKIVTLFNIVLIILVAVFAILIKTEVISVSDKNEELFAAAIVSVVIIFSGIISPRLPYNRHVGLRLPWTVQNEGAWNIAHRVLGIISIPLGLIYMSLTFLVGNMERLTLIVMIIWIGAPGLISFVYAYRK